MREVSEKLQKLKDLGYVKVAFIVENKSPLVLDILMIHSSWTEYSFTRQFEQASRDLEACLGERCLFSLEIPTLEMYQQERHEDAPDHDHLVFDLMGKKA